jgi:SAM-dependent methyltransferase
MAEESKDEKIRKMVREGYADIVKSNSSCCGDTQSYSSCCGSATPEEIGKKIGYSAEELAAVPEGANLGLGCGNPTALASLKPGETVLDLGSGAGFDCFLAANKVGSTGKVIGVDMTPDMLETARENARKGNYNNVEFRLGEIEHLPTADNSVDVIISNCVINLSPDKSQVFSEAYRVLKSGGRLMVSDMVLLKPLPEFIQGSMRAYIGCLGGAILKEDYLDGLTAAGFSDVHVIDQTPYSIDSIKSDRTILGIMEEMSIPLEKLKELDGTVESVKVSAIKS